MSNIEKERGKGEEINGKNKADERVLNAVWYNVIISNTFSYVISLQVTTTQTRTWDLSPPSSGLDSADSGRIRPESARTDKRLLSLSDIRSDVLQAGRGVSEAMETDHSLDTREQPECAGRPALDRPGQWWRRTASDLPSPCPR